MSKSLAKEVEKLEEAAERKKETEVFEICGRYGYKAEELVKHGTKYEKNTVFKYFLPKSIEDFMNLFEVFGPIVFEVAFERLIYPAVLSDDLAEENENVVLAIDHAYLQLVNPDLWKEFMMELKESKTRISQHLKKKFDEARKEREKLKNSIREKMRKAEEEDKLDA